MKIVRGLVPVMTIEDFAEANRLTMEVRERKVPLGSPNRFYARFASSETKEYAGDGILSGTYGSGATEAEAIADYAKEISLKLLVLDAWKPTRREIEVPRLTAPLGDPS